LGKNNKILFGIVCFREKYFEAESFKTLLVSFNLHQKDGEELNIFIYDNTDNKYWEVLPTVDLDDNVKISYFHNPLNEGISAAFNYFADYAKANDFEWIVFLDQDTELPKVFYDKYYLHSVSIGTEKIAFPKIFSNNRLLSPSEYRYYRTKSLVLQNEEKLRLNNITAINSGLMIKTLFFIEQGGYDKHLRIDFCDHEFIERIPKEMFADLIDVSLDQNFSLETNDKVKSLTRYRLYVKDMKVYRKNKHKFFFFFRVDLPHLLKEIYRNKSLEFLKIRLNG